ncbi:serine/threonine-protein kinase [Actinoplanes sp. CA-252034]|uniref:serine/threonine-protein kinase n=1 Tax=Actinoplanes sp. CA-252034 TaxID=3239906 RepID=UPI003D99A42F
MPHTGELLGGRYRLDDRIGAGGMGEVWQATDTVLGRAVAVKTLLADRATDPGFQRRFRHEAQALAALRHPGVVPVYDFGNTAVEDAYLVMARVEGQPLNRMLAERGRLSPAETMSVVAQAAQALEAAHEAGIVHRDVKPGNLLIEADGTVVLVDFGVARSAHSATVTGAGEVVGTALYIAPEQVSQHVAGPPADVYALGALAYHCLAGHPPFQGNNPIAIALQHLEDEPPELPGDVPPAVRDLVRTALSKRPEDRFASAGVMAEAAYSAGASAAGGTGSPTGTAVTGSPAGTGAVGSPIGAGTIGFPAGADAIGSAGGTGAIGSAAGADAIGSPAGAGEDLAATRAGSPWIGALGMQPLDETSINYALDHTAPGPAVGDATEADATGIPRQRPAPSAGATGAGVAAGGAGAAGAAGAAGVAAGAAGAAGVAASANRNADAAAALPTAAGGTGTTTRPAAPERTSPGAPGGATTDRRRPLALLVLAAVVLLGGLGVLVATDPLGWFADEPKPATGVPAAPVSSGPRSAGAPAGGGNGEKATTRPERTTETDDDDRPTSAAATTRPAEAATTAPTATATTGDTATPTQTTTTPPETGEPEDDETEPGANDGGANDGGNQAADNEAAGNPAG